MPVGWMPEKIVLGVWDEVESLRWEMHVKGLGAIRGEEMSRMLVLEGGLIFE